MCDSYVQCTEKQTKCDIYFIKNDEFAILGTFNNSFYFTDFTHDLVENGTWEGEIQDENDCLR